MDIGVGYPNSPSYHGAHHITRGWVDMLIDLRKTEARIHRLSPWLPLPVTTITGP